MLLSIDRGKPVFVLTGKDIQAVNDTNCVRLELDMASAFLIENAVKIGEGRLIAVDAICAANSPVYRDMAVSFATVQIVHSALQVGDHGIDPVCVQLFVAP